MSMLDSIVIPGANCWRVEYARRAAFLVDACDYFDAFARAALRAEHSLFIIGWDFDSRIPLWCEDAPSAVPGQLGDFLNYLVRRRRRLVVRVLCWDFPMIYGVERELPMWSGDAWRRSHRIQFRYDAHHPFGASQHQKLVVVDDAVAFAGGIDLTHHRWDTPEHCAGDPRRSFQNAPYTPFHDVMMAVDGAAARALGDLARERWRRCTGKQVAPVGGAPDRWPEGLHSELHDVRVAIARTEPAHNSYPEVREVEALYLDAIQAARRFIYMENQYFTSVRVGEAIEARLAEQDGPEVVIVLREQCRGWLEEAVMGTLRARLIRRLRAADRYGRLGIYHPVVPGPGEGFVNVHSKVMVIDDRFVRVGSANLNNRSMGLDSECDLAIEANEHTTRLAIAGFRDRLLAEHLGVPSERVAAELARTRSLGGTVMALATGERRLEPIDDLDQWPETVESVAELADPERPVSIDALTQEFLPVTAPEPSGVNGWVKLFGMLMGIGVLFALWRFTPLREVVTADAVGHWAEAFGSQPWAPLAILLAYVPASVIMFPRPLITLAAVVAFGPWVGSLYALAGIQVAALSGYVAGRGLSRDRLRRLGGSRLHALSTRLRTGGLGAMVLVRLVPVAPFIVVSLFAGAARVGLGTFALGTGIGMAPGLIGMTVFGSQVGNALGSDGDLNAWLIGGVIALIAAASLLARRLAAHGQHRDPARSQPGRPPLPGNGSRPAVPARSAGALLRSSTHGLQAKARVSAERVAPCRSEQSVFRSTQ
jgi:phosphatidylserine/phosphatidylglycerophosphate/cardiolipin synthase-like enzyme/uncharacterized membrane protein YdjX (TVP38/TMEM64 family)